MKAMDGPLLDKSPKYFGIAFGLEVPATTPRKHNTHAMQRVVSKYRLLHRCSRPRRSESGVGCMRGKRMPTSCGVRCAVCGVRCAGAVCGVRCAVCGVRVGGGGHVPNLLDSQPFELINVPI